MPTAKTENETELENKKRGKRQRCSIVPSEKCGYEKTHIFRNTHEATHPQVSLLPGVAALLKHQCTKVMVHSQVTGTNALTVNFL